MLQDAKSTKDSRVLATGLALWVFVWSAGFIAAPFVAMRSPQAFEMFEGVGRAVYAVGLMFFVVIRVLELMRRTNSAGEEASRK
jgi:hypothetical protein